MSNTRFTGIKIVALLAVLVVASCTPQTEAIPTATEQIEEVSQATPTTEPTQDVQEEPQPTEEMKEEASEGTTAEEDTSAEEGGAAGVVTFAVVQSESEARFTLDELLRGNPKTVVGVTDQVFGEIQVDFGNPAASQVGPVQINADTLVTDSSFRNQAIQRFILQTGQHEFITFVPTAITGLPESLTLGESVTLTITGDLTIREITQEVVFEATVTAVSESRLEGYASTTVARADYDLTIPEVQQVANVDELVFLEIEFVAESQ